ncbi:hypothetical protein GF1_00240 [Desulfolithobacter dissulfuricans]|uniref:SsrA-binding protein n=1 Tax=Desulfolithobacter dissulfuricans TaxID=2795293 RepID=A0A915XJB3_9BACT|nr:hypothetical protein GF1_00240 [Desulfolithobacter dissulfuricans]
MGQRIVCRNKKAFHDYHIDDRLEAGIVLTGPEVKSLRAGRANLKDGYAKVKNGEVFLYNVHISPIPLPPMYRPIRCGFASSCSTSGKSADLREN